MCLLFGVSPGFAQKVTNDDVPQTINELQDSIQKILIETKTPGAGVVMVAGDSVVLLMKYGMADVKNNIDVDENTLFRLGSVSKLFVGLAILKLQEEGRLSLKDKVKDLIPDLKIINPWEDKYPVRVENLLEHTAGLNNWSLAELGCNNPNLKSLKASLEYYPKGRVVKYVPGSRSSYSNLGVSIAAYIVEKVSGMPYEVYVDNNFFKPMGITDMSFGISDKYEKTGAKGYENGNLMPFLYPLYRPSAGLIGSPKDLSYLLRFFIHRGKINNTQLLSDASLQRMEQGESFTVSNSDLFNDNPGLTNIAIRYRGFAYYGHGGHVPGSNADFRYLPEYNLGFAVTINEEDQSIIDNRISRLIMAYQTKDLPKESTKPINAIRNSTSDLSGYYLPVSYKFEFMKFFFKVKQLQKIVCKDDTIYLKSILGEKYKIKFIQTGKNEFRSADNNRIGFIQVNDPVAGQVIYGNIGMYKKTASIYAYALLVIFGAFYIVAITAIIFAALRILIFLFGKNKNKKALWICLWPFISISFILVIVVAIMLSIQTNIDYFLLLGNISPLSLLIFAGTIGFALASFWSVYFIFKNRRVKMSKIFYYHSVMAAIFNLILTIYFIGNGVIGISTWL